jgi:uncharacterized protein YndB with AHSA1/START domain
MSNPVTITAPEGLPFIDIEREFDAPVAAVFNAHRDPALYAQWVGPKGYVTDFPYFDFTTGGGYRFVSTDPQGQKAAFHGVFHVVRENDFAMQTFEFEGWPDVVSLESLTFTALDGGRTRLNIHSVYPSVEARNGMVQSGMEHGVTEGYEKLDALVGAGTAS